jgi:flavin prenyltransferase
MVTPERPLGQGMSPFHRDRFAHADLQGLKAPEQVRGAAEMAMKPGRPRLIVGISGASGAIYGARLLEMLQPLPVETHLVMSRSAEVTLTLETGLKPAALRGRADVVHAIGDLAAPISSGSFPTIGMIVAPCSVRSMAEIATGATTTLLSRAADVVLKERRRLVLLVRETPLHTGHLRTMTALSEMGAVIAPPVPAFYAKPRSLEEMIDQTLGRALDLFGIDTGVVRRWGEPEPAGGRPKRGKIDSG